MEHQGRRGVHCGASQEVWECGGVRQQCQVLSVASCSSTAARLSQDVSARALSKCGKKTKGKWGWRLWVAAFRTGNRTYLMCDGGPNAV